MEFLSSVMVHSRLQMPFRRENYSLIRASPFLALATQLPRKEAVFISERVFRRDGFATQIE